MTPEQERLRDAFLAEMWPTCREWHAPLNERADAEARNAILAAVDDVPDSVDRKAS